MIQYFISSSGKYIGVLEPDQMARDPRADKDLAPELIPQLAELYDDGDVWLSTIYIYVPRLKPGAIYRSSEEMLAQSMLGEQLDCCGEQFGYDYAKDLLLSALENLDRTGELL